MTVTPDKTVPKGWYRQRRSEHQDHARARQQRLAEARVIKSDDDLIAEAVAKGQITRVPSYREDQREPE
jgi:hypothetical protein